MRQFKPRRCARCEREFMPKAPSSRWCSVMCRLLDNCDQSGGADACWPWLKNVDNKGYGRLTVHGRLDRVGKGKGFFAHRVMFELHTGEILAPEIKVLHSCDNPPCINPDHLFKGTQLDNVHDMMRKGRAGYTLNKARGSKHHGATISEETALAIFKSSLSLDKAAAHFGVTRDIVGKIRYGVSWNHVTGLPRKFSAKDRNERRATRSLGVYCGMLGFGA